MAGKRQHYVPRLLQRGFLADPCDEAERAWLHRHGQAPKLVGIRDIGVADWFYSRRSQDGQPTLDDAITDYEGGLSSTVNALRETDPGSIVPSRHAAETVVHLVLRAAHLRNLMATGVAQLSDEIASLFGDPARLARLLGVAGPGLGELAESAIREAAVTIAPAGVPAAFAERPMAFLLRELGDQLVLNAMTELTPLLGDIFGDIAARMRDAHNASLARPIEDNGWVAELTTFSWTIEAGADLILPDAIALSRGQNERLAPLLFTSGAETDLVVLALATDRILVGRRDGATFAIKAYNADAAAASESFFIARRAMTDGGLTDRIGTGPAAVMMQAIQDVISEVETASPVGTGDILPVSPEERIVQDFSYTIRLADFGDAALAREIADIVQAVIATLARDLPLQDFDGLTIAVDYPAALAGLDRGDPSLGPVATGALGYGEGVAKPVTVRRDGVRKEHLVVAAGIADAWLAEEPERRAFGLHALVKMLAGIAHTTRYADVLGIGFKPDPMAREFHMAVAMAPSGYWSARRAAFVAPNEAATYAELVLTSLDNAERAVATERATMADPHDIGPTVTCALACAAAILDHAADWLGHRDGLVEDEAFAGDDLPERLKARGLDRWIDLFGRDLAACYGPDGTLELPVLVTLGRHVERLLWSLGVFCWPEGEDVRCIVAEDGFFPPRVPSSGGSA